MRFVAMVRATRASEAGEMPSEKLLTEMTRFNEELVKAGVMLAGEGLHPSRSGARVRYEGDQLSSLEEAIEWMKRAPNPFEDGVSEIEIRRVFEAEDFGDAFTPEARELEAQQRARLGDPR